MNSISRAVVLVSACAASACVPLGDVAQVTSDAAAAVQGAVATNNGAATPADATGAVLEVATWVLAALGLGPLSRVLMAAKPAVVGVAGLLFGKRTEKPAPTS